MTLKTTKAIAKRFKLTKKGKIKYSSSGRSHLLSAKESSRKRKLRKPHYLKRKKYKKTIKRLLPYG